MCSDGLSDMLDDEAIAQLLLAEPFAGRGGAGLIDAANEAGGKDNISVVLARVARRQCAGGALLVAVPALEADQQDQHGTGAARRQRGHEVNAWANWSFRSTVW